MPPPVIDNTPTCSSAAAVRALLIGKPGNRRSVPPRAMVRMVLAPHCPRDRLANAGTASASHARRHPILLRLKTSRNRASDPISPVRLLVECPGQASSAGRWDLADEGRRIRGRTTVLQRSKYSVMWSRRCRGRRSSADRGTRRVVSKNRLLARAAPGCICSVRATRLQFGSRLATSVRTEAAASAFVAASTRSVLSRAPMWRGSAHDQRERRRLHCSRGLTFAGSKASATSGGRRNRNARYPLSRCHIRQRQSSGSRRPISVNQSAHGRALRRRPVPALPRTTLRSTKVTASPPRPTHDSEAMPGLA